MNYELISVIVLAYNIENYIIECLNSIKNQTYSLLEVIIINDGSTDNTLSKIKEFCENDSRFNFFTKKNGGPSSSRNYGLKKIKGSYFMFVDGDDVLDLNCINTLYSNLKKTSCDISICGFEKFNRIYNKCEKNYTVKKYNRKNYYKEILNLKKNTYVWGILYPSSFADIIIFPNNMFFEDLAVFPSIINQCKSICYNNAAFVKYRQNHNSIVHSYNPKKINDYLLYADAFCKCALEECKDIKDLCNVYLANAYMTAIYLSLGNTKDNIKEYKKMIRFLLKGTKINSINRNLRIKFKLFKISATLGTFVLKIKKRCIG